MTEKELKQLQLAISKEILCVLKSTGLNLNKAEKLSYLNLKLDSLNRAAYYSMKEVPGK